jgi:menaquinone-specific isochorismate synthase
MSPAAALGLVARTRATAIDADLLASVSPDDFVWMHDGAAFVATGVVATVPAAEVEVALAVVEVDDAVRRPGTGAIAVGALPFDPTAPAELVIPARVMGRAADGTTWVTEISAVAPGTPVPSRPTRVDRVGGTTAEEWRAAIETVLAAIEHGTVEKVVLARDLVLEADVPFDVRTVLGALHTEQVGCYVYAHRGLVGATPELLVRRRDGVATSTPMAGTARGTDAEAIGALTHSPKDAREHALVVDAVVATLGAHGAAAPEVRGPEIVELPNLVHLATHIAVTLGPDAPGALSLARALHPTPAVGGAPTAPALDLIATLEPRGRDRYAGPVGWVDGNGDGEFAIALRGAVLDGTRARCFAGCGIVAGSDPEAEWAEAERKFGPMLRALGAD